MLVVASKIRRSTAMGATVSLYATRVSSGRGRDMSAVNLQDSLVSCNRRKALKEFRVPLDKI